MFIGGLDIGTTGCKLTVYDENGKCTAVEYREYDSEKRTDEINAEVIYNAVGQVIKNCSLITEIDAVGVTSFGETFVMLDENDRVLLPSMLYTHPAGKEECAVFENMNIAEIAGVKAGYIFSIPKIMWIKNKYPDIYAKAVRILLMQDYIVYMLTGIAQIDYSMAARTMGFDIKNKCWSREIFSLAGIDMNKMSKPVMPGTAAGISNKFGLKNAVIVNGCHDQIAAAIGTGVFEENTAADGIGTVECITPILNDIPHNSSFYEGGYSVIPYIKKNKYVCYAFTFAGGASLKWYKSNFEKEASYEELDISVNPMKPTGILVLPHFAGAATPYMDNGSKAVFAGITFDTSKKELYQALMEGVTYEMLFNLERLYESGIKLEKLMASGGGAKSKKWLQIKANIMNLPITSTASEEAGSLGTVMLTGVAVGAFKSIEEASEIFLEEKETFYPDENVHNEYMKIYEKYKKLYSSVRNII